MTEQTCSSVNLSFSATYHHLDLPYLRGSALALFEYVAWLQKRWPLGAQSLYRDAYLFKTQTLSAGADFTMKQCGI